MLTDKTCGRGLSVYINADWCVKAVLVCSNHSPLQDFMLLNEHHLGFCNEGGKCAVLTQKSLVLLPSVHQTSQSELKHKLNTCINTPQNLNTSFSTNTIHIHNCHCKYSFIYYILCLAAAIICTSYSLLRSSSILYHLVLPLCNSEEFNHTTAIVFCDWG